MQFQQDFNRKKRKDHRDNNLRRFFFAIYAFFVVTPFLVAVCRLVSFAPFCGNPVPLDHA
jgi:hypothetical protein